MFWSIAPLVLACVVLAGVLGHVLVSGQRAWPGAGADVRRAGALQADADALKIPDPVAEAARRVAANSGSRNGIDGGRTDPASGQPARAVSSTVGIWHPSGMYISLTQSNADEDKLVGSIDADMYPTGRSGCRRRHVGGLRGRRQTDAEPVWTTQLQRPDRAGAGRDNGWRRYGRVPYAGGGDAERLAAARQVGAR